MLKLKEEVVNVCDGYCELVDNINCCRDYLFFEEDFIVVDIDCLLGDSFESFNGEEVYLEIEKVIKSYFERGELDDRVFDF